MNNNKFLINKEIKNNLIKVKNKKFEFDSPILQSITYDGRIYIFLSKFQSTNENIIIYA